MSKQPAELVTLLMRVLQLEETPENDDLDLKEAANLCNELIMARTDELLVFCFHDSEVILKSIEPLRNVKTVTVFYLD